MTVKAQRELLLEARALIVWLLAYRNGKSEGEIEQYFRDFPDTRPKVVAQIDDTLENKEP